jgi:vacuolar-type H+-ATPase subunit B/Vma2
MRAFRPVESAPLQPTARHAPDGFIQTGILRQGSHIEPTQLQGFGISGKFSGTGCPD